jgi:hypothetical protein
LAASIFQDSVMSETAQQLLMTFESLPPQEQHDVLVEILRHSRELPSGEVSDNELTSVADSLFQMLDAEESNGSTCDKR